MCVWVSKLPHVQCMCVFVTPCMHAAALPTGIRSFRHIFTSSAFKGINIAPAAVAGLNGWLGGEEGGWMSNAISPPLLPSLAALIRYDMRSSGGCCRWLSPQRQDPEATATACVLCLEEYTILFICIYISGSRCSSLSISIHLRVCNIRHKKGAERRKRGRWWGCAADLQMLPLTSTKPSLINFC